MTDMTDLYDEIRKANHDKIYENITIMVENSKFLYEAVKHYHGINGENNQRKMTVKVTDLWLSF